MSAEPTQRRLVDQRHEIRSACKRLVRYIYEHDLGEGDRLPPQEMLRRQFGVRHDTITAAMHLLVQYDVVRRKPKAGTVVVNRHTVIPGLWTVGVLVYDYQEQVDNFFIVSLLWALQGYLAAAGCQWRVYHRAVERRMEPNRLGDFPELEADLAAGRIDAVLTPTDVRQGDLDAAHQAGTVVCRIGPAHVARSGVVIDQTLLAEQAVPGLRQAGCRTVGVVGTARMLESPAHGLRRSLSQAIRQAKMRGKLWLVAPGQGHHAGIAAGRAVGRALLERPPAQRPDGLLVMSDVLTLGLTQTLVTHKYRPVVAAMTNRQIPMVFPLPVTRFELDIDRLASAAVALTLQRLRWSRHAKKLQRIPLEQARDRAGADHAGEESVHVSAM